MWRFYKRIDDFSEFTEVFLLIPKWAIKRAGFGIRLSIPRHSIRLCSILNFKSE